MAQLVQRLSGDLSMKLKIVGHNKDFIISPNLSRGWEAPDKSFGDNMHNSLRAVLERSTGPYACDSSLAKGSQPLESLSSQFQKMGLHLLRGLMGHGLAGPAASSSDAPPLAAFHAKDPAVAGSDTGSSTSAAGFHEQLEKLGATAEWENLAHDEQGAVLDAAIELNAQRAKGEDRCDTEGDDPDDGGNDPNDPEAANQSSQVSR